MTDFSLGNLLAKIFGAEDDWLGSYENSWRSDNNWGIGRYTDIACKEKDGTLGLRLWFNNRKQGSVVLKTFLSRMAVYTVAGQEASLISRTYSILKLIMMSFSGGHGGLTSSEVDYGMIARCILMYSLRFNLRASQFGDVLATNCLAHPGTG